MSTFSLLDLKSLTADNVGRLFALADQLSGESLSERSRGEPPLDRKYFENRRGLTAALVFFEASTRTRMSFETACAREGLTPILLDTGGGTSLEKGETPEDTILNIAAMNPSVMVIRCNDDVDLANLSERLKTPLLNGGWGRRGHPTQALLDAFAVRRRTGRIEGQRVLLIGDVRHSRVAASHLELAKILGYEVALCGPKDFLPAQTDARVFLTLAEGLQWCTVAMALRVQFERHVGLNKNTDGWHPEEWQLNSTAVKNLRADGVIMHPGPVNWGVELSAEMAHDPRAIILDQVAGGVWVRQALIRQMLEAGK